MGIQFLYNDQVYKLIENLIKSLNWTGVAHIDLRYDDVEKNFKVIEINPRFWASIEASKEVGVNFPYLYCLTSLGIKYNIPKYKFEKYANNRGIMKVIKSKFSFNNKIEFPENSTIQNDLLDPFPKIMKYISKVQRKIFK